MAAAGGVWVKKVKGGQRKVLMPSDKMATVRLAYKGADGKVHVRYAAGFDSDFYNMVTVVKSLKERHYDGKGTWIVTEPGMQLLGKKLAIKTKDPKPAHLAAVPATDKQKAFIKSKQHLLDYYSIRVPPKLTKQKASTLIDAITQGDWGLKKLKGKTI